MSETTLYKPKGSRCLSEGGVSQIRTGIQGAAFTGKTTAALTFPNPVVASFDKKLSAHTHRSDVLEVPFWDGAFCDSIIKRSGLANPPNRRDAFLKWLCGDALNLTVDQNLVVDNSSGVEAAYHIQYRIEPAISSKGEENSYAEWGLKLDYFRDLFVAFNALKCGVIYLIHEYPDRDKKGELNGKIRPILTGQAGDKIESNFTNWFGAVAQAKPKNEKEVKAIKEWAGIDDETLKEWISSTPPTHQSIYLWQTQNDNIRNCGTTSLFNVPKFVLANYSSFAKYQRKAA